MTASRALTPAPRHLRKGCSQSHGSADECSVAPGLGCPCNQPFHSRRCPNGVDLGSDFDEFVRDSSPGLLRTAYLLTGDRGHAEDVVQTALLQVARKWRRIRGEPAPYARRAVVNLAKNHWRDRFRRPHESTEAIEPCYAPPDADVLLRHVLLPTVMDLPVRQRAVLVLRYFQDLSV